ncbi:DUF2280 domain-containing protein [Hyphomicrobium sp. DY-1]|uniref:DUF2280 domain-containing protein n=1 Tax=Hyphomicrobium sp. DY-1 TaxID=3075650 RepID=UPI0039C2C05D
MAKQRQLSDEVKAFIVMNLAAFEPPSVVIDLVKQEFGIVVSKQSVSGYDPKTKTGQRMSAKWKVLFEKARKDFKESTDDIPLASKAVRVRTLNRMAMAAVEKKNPVLAASLMKQIAEEMGEVYTNRHKLEHTGKDGGPIRSEQAVDLSGLNDEELAAYRIVAAASERYRDRDRSKGVH